MRILFVMLALLQSSCGNVKADEKGDLLAKISQAERASKPDLAVELANQLVALDGDDPTGRLVRASLLTERGRFNDALPDWDALVKISPEAEVVNQRGRVRFQAGKIADALTDFDRAIALKPKLEAPHWERGICYYYLGDWEKGRKQFEQYQGVDDNDVENVVWRAMCMARDPKIGWDKASADLWKVKLDRRVPLMVVHQLFASKATPDDVLKAVDDGAPGEDELLSRRFYAHLYLGLYYDCRNDPKTALEHLELAAGKYKLPGYMAEVARVHVERLKASPPKK